MERVTNQNSLEVLRQANDHFGHFFARFSGAPVLGTGEEVEAILQVKQTLHSVALLLDRRLQKSDVAAVQDELQRYRQNLLRLRHELAIMQSAAIATRGRLSARQNHIRAAQAWCAASRDTT
jgi:hypothetical protein